MDADDATGAIPDAENALFKIVSSGLQKATEEAAKTYGKDILTKLLPVAVGTLSGPLAAGAAAMMGSLVESILKQTSETDRKLDRLLAEPFETATRTVKEILSEEVRTEGEEAHAERRLYSASELLNKAYTHADEERPQKRRLVRLYQCFVAAFLPGGGAEMRRCVEDIRDLASAARAESARLIDSADLVRRTDATTAEKYLGLKHRRRSMTSDGMRSPFGRLSNALHLSTQVPSKLEFLTAGPSRTIYIRNLRIRLKHASVRRFRVKHYVVQLIFEALRFLGPSGVSGEDIKTIRTTITEADRQALGSHIGDAPIWMQPHLRQITLADGGSSLTE